MNFMFFLSYGLANGPLRRTDLRTWGGVAVGPKLAARRTKQIAILQRSLSGKDLRTVKYPVWEKGGREETEKGKTLRKRMFLLTFAFVVPLITKWQRLRNRVWSFKTHRAIN